MKKMIFFSAICFALFINSAILHAQVNQDWIAYYGSGNGVDFAYQVAVDGSGNVFVTGKSGGDYATIKYNSSGVQQWIRYYNGPGNGTDVAACLAVDGSENVYVSGRSIGNGTNYDFATIKYNTSGDSLWVARYNGPGNGQDGVQAMTIDGLGNIYVTGFSFGSGTGFDYATIKYNSSGVQQWVSRYSGPGSFSDYTYAIAVDGTGNLYVTGGSTISVGPLNIQYATIKYNSSGVQQWVSLYNGPGNGDNEANAITVDGAGNVYVTGYSTGNEQGFDYATIKYNSMGVQQWVQRYIGPGYEAYAIAVDGSENVYVTGSAATIKYNSSGVQQWVSSYNNYGGSSLVVDGSGNVYVTADATIKYNSSGVQQWIKIYTTLFARSIAIDSTGHVYVTGDSGGGEYYITIKYSQPIGIKPISTEIPGKYNLSQNYPNPFNPSTKINFALPKSGFTKLIIYDVLGRKVATVVDEDLKAGIYSVDWNGSNYPSGVYFYKLTTESFTETKKLILLK